jgi:hypothetical protein
MLNLFFTTEDRESTEKTYSKALLTLLFQGIPV